MLEILHSSVEEVVQGVLLIQLVGSLGLQVLHHQVFVVTFLQEHRLVVQCLLLLFVLTWKLMQ